VTSFNPLKIHISDNGQTYVFWIGAKEKSTGVSLTNHPPMKNAFLIPKRRALRSASLIATLALFTALALNRQVCAQEQWPQLTWRGGAGLWGEVARWAGGAPDALSRVNIGGASDVVVPPGRWVVGSLRVAIDHADKVQLHIRGELIVRRYFLEIGDRGHRDAGAGEVSLEDGGSLTCASEISVSNGPHPEIAPGLLRVSGGRMMARSIIVTGGTLAVEGSKASCLRVFGNFLVDASWGKKATPAALSFRLDEQGVTPITCSRASIKGGRLAIALSAVPPRDDVVLIAAQEHFSGAFADLPEGSEIAADFQGRTYRWNLTYRGGPDGRSVILRSPRGFAADAPATHCLPVTFENTPAWLSVPPPESSVVETEFEPAFPGAEGYGAVAQGGRGGRILYVDTLEDGGPGSLREAIGARGPRIVTFRVGGAIHLKKPLMIDEPFLTLTGEAAPGDGIELRNQTVYLHTHDVILRYLRVRPGEGDDGKNDDDALTISGAARCIVDHCSFSWSTDEIVSIVHASDLITIQWCFINEALNFRNHALGTVSGGERATWHHNLTAHNRSRNPRLSFPSRTDFRNNVIYDWGGATGYGECESLNYVANYLKPGPTTTQHPPLFFSDYLAPKSAYFAGNVIEGYPESASDNWRAVVGWEGHDSKVSEPFAAPPVQTDPAPVAFERVLQQAGATLPHRDAVDARVVEETLHGAGRVIEHIQDVGGYSKLKAGPSAAK